MSRIKSVFTNVPKGRQTVQTYSPSMGVDYELKISTFNGKGWNVAYCSNKDKSKVCSIEISKLFNTRD